MLEEQKHVIAVDILFDDDVISDFVKSIQIDSPYQQMLLEGVLTESVKEEEVFVSFTVEGYFHYVLGEVIWAQTKSLGPSALKSIIEKSEMKGAIEGVEQCLLRDLDQNDLSRIMWLIDQGEESLEAASVPLAHAFMQIRENAKSKEAVEALRTKQVERVLSELLAESSENDLVALTKAIAYLESTQNQELLKHIYTLLNARLTYTSVLSCTLLANSVKYVEKDQRSNKLQLLEEAFSAFQKNEKLQRFFTGLGAQFKTLGNYEKALEYYTLSLNLSQTLFGEQHMSTAIAYSDVGSAYSEMGNYSDALQYYTTSLEIRISLFGESDPQTAAGFSNVGAMWSKKGELDTALNYYSKALAIRIKSRGNFHLETALSYTNAGAIYSKKKDVEQARAYYSKSLDIRMSILGEHHLDTAVSQTNMGALYSKVGELDQALFYYEKSLASRLLHLESHHPDIALNLTNIGAIYSKKGDYNTALDYYRRVLEIRAEALGENHDKIALSMVNYGSVLAKVKRKPEALEYYKKALSIYIQVFGNEHEKTTKLLEKIEKL
jgi:tetratricopeptide (TPR) repeat protein